jgi:MFS family permease
MRIAAGSGPAYVVIFGRFLTNIGFFMVIPFFAIHLTRDVGMSSLQAGGLFAVLEFTRRGLGIAAGWVSDRFGASRVLTLGLLLEVVAYVGFAGVGRSFGAWVAVVALLGVGGSLNNNGARSLLATVQAGGAAVVNLSRYYVSVNGAALIGPLIGTALTAGGLIRVGFLIAAALHLAVAGVTGLLLRTVSGSQEASSIRPADALTALHDRPLVLYCLLAVGGWLLITQYRWPCRSPWSTRTCRPI